jgi:hypothetical protein
MSERPIDPHALNVRSFCSDAGSSLGRWPLAGLGRLLDSLYVAPSADDRVDWQAQGSLVPATGAEPEILTVTEARAFGDARSTTKVAAPPATGTPTDVSVLASVAAAMPVPLQRAFAQAPTSTLSVGYVM